jgi:ATP-dependent DNA ligase
MPSWPHLSQRILHDRNGIAITLFVFDVLRVEGDDTMCLPYMERRTILEVLELPGVARVIDSSMPGSGTGRQPLSRPAAPDARTDTTRTRRREATARRRCHSDRSLQN